MNFAGAVILVLVLAGGVFGLFMIASNTSSTPFVDTYGIAPNTSVNTSQVQVVNATATAGQFGGGALLIVGLLVLIIIGSYAAWAMTKTGGYRSSYR
jgi:hypothetical protein